MSEDDLRGRLDRLESIIEARLTRHDEKLDNLRNEMREQRREIQEQSREAHNNIYKRLDANDVDTAVIKAMYARLQENEEKHVPFEIGFNGKVVQFAIFTGASALGAVIVSVVTRWFS